MNLAYHPVGSIAEIDDPQADEYGEYNPTFRSIGPKDLEDGEKLLIEFSKIFPEGYVPGKENPNENSDERLVSTLLQEATVEETYNGNPPVQFKQRYDDLKNRADEFRGSLVTAEKAQKVEGTIRAIRADIAKNHPDLSPEAQRNLFRSIYDRVVLPSLSRVGNGSANFIGIAAEIEKAKSGKLTTEPYGVNSILSPQRTFNYMQRSVPIKRRMN